MVVRMSGNNGGNILRNIDGISAGRLHPPDGVDRQARTSDLALDPPRRGCHIDIVPAAGGVPMENSDRDFSDARPVGSNQSVYAFGLGCVISRGPMRAPGCLARTSLVFSRRSKEWMVDNRHEARSNEVVFRVSKLHLGDNSLCSGGGRSDRQADQALRR